MIMKPSLCQKLYSSKKAVLITVANLCAAARVAAAQSCAMCYQNAAASGTRGKLALQHGILILALPAIAIFGAILFLLYSRRNVGGNIPKSDERDREMVREGNRPLPQVMA
jgi:hypothetical protein